jgi:hypothetical protein
MGRRMKGTKGTVAWGCKWPQTKRGPKLPQMGMAGLFVDNFMSA